MKVLVTGGAGFIGAHIVDVLLADGHDVDSVYILDDLSGGFIENIDIRTSKPRSVFIKGSITDHEYLAKLFEEEKFDYVYHCAAYAAEGLSHFIRRFNYTNNLIGSISIVNECIKHKVKCLVFTSSIAVYGNIPKGLAFFDGRDPDPIDPYGVSKYAVEMDLKIAREMFGLNYIIFRPHNVYGELQNIGDPYRNVVGIFMNQVLQGKPFTIFGDGEQKRAFTYAPDIAPYLARSIFTPAAYNKTFNIGSRYICTVNYLAEEVRRVMGAHNHPAVYLPARHEVVEAYSDHGLFETVFGTMPETPLGEGLWNMAEWVKSKGARQGKKFSNIEIEEKLPQSWKELTC